MKIEDTLWAKNLTWHVVICKKICFHSKPNFHFGENITMPYGFWKRQERFKRNSKIKIIMTEEAIWQMPFSKKFVLLGIILFIVKNHFWCLWLSGVDLTIPTKPNHQGYSETRIYSDWCNNNNKKNHLIISSLLRKTLKCLYFLNSFSHFDETHWL